MSWDSLEQWLFDLRKIEILNDHNSRKNLDYKNLWIFKPWYIFGFKSNRWHITARSWDRTRWGGYLSVADWTHVAVGTWIPSRFYPVRSRGRTKLANDWRLKVSKDFAFHITNSKWWTKILVTKQFNFIFTNLKHFIKSIMVRTLLRRIFL